MRADDSARRRDETVEIPDRVIEIVRTFVSGDREFRPGQRKGGGSAPATAAAGGETEEE